jgi:hypothetical protein
MLNNIQHPENERFDKDFSVADKRQREKDFDYRERVKDRHRVEALEREQFKWDRLEKMEAKE